MHSHMNRPNSAVVCWLYLAVLWLYCVLQFICIRFHFFGIILCYSLFVYVHFCCVRLSFFSTMPRDWWYEDGAGNTTEENSSIFSLILMR